jgi:protein ImuB
MRSWGGTARDGDVMSETCANTTGIGESGAPAFVANGTPESCEGTAPEVRDSSVPPGRRVLCLHLPYLPTDRARRDCPGLLSCSAGRDEATRAAARGRGPLRPEADATKAGRPLVLTRRVGSSLVLEHVDVCARRIGLRAGMTLGQAQAIVPELLTLEHEPRRDWALLERLAHWALRFSPIVQPVEPDALLLDITGCQRLFGGEANIARQAYDGLRAQGFHTRVAIADTVGAASALASASSEAIAIAPPGQTRTYLAPLPPVALRIEPEVAEQLDSLGVRTIADLLALPRASLAARFGSQLVLRLQQALGEVYEEITAHSAEQPPAARISFETPLADLETIQVVVARLLEELFAQLRDRTLALRRVDCVLIYEDASPTVLAIGLSTASRAWRHIHELVTRRLETADFSRGLIALRLIARETALFKAGQIELFEPRDPNREEEFGCLLDRLVNRLGERAVVRVEQVDDYQPERAFRYVSVAEGAEKKFAAQRKTRVDDSCPPRLKSRVTCPSVIPSAARNLDADTRPRQIPQSLRSFGMTNAASPHTASPHGASSHAAQPRPTQLLPRPLPIRVIALVPDGPPTWLAWRGREYVVAHAWGPERIETGWWRGPDIRRDYFRVSVETGEQFWIFHSPTDGRWYLHGVFA